MERYIDADKLRQELVNRQITTQFFNPRERHEIGCIIEMLDNAPTADVVPKSEVDEIVRQWKEEANCWQNNYIADLRDNEQIKKQVAREIFEDIEISLKRSKRYNLKSGTYFECYLEGYIANLKKKYTEDEG